MLKKSIIFIITVLALLFFASFSFATNLGNDIKDSMQKAGNTISNMANDVTSASENMMNNMGNSMNNVMSGMRNTMNNDNSNNRNISETNSNNGNYTTSRVSALEDTTNNGMMWIWIVIGIAALAIIGLSWYYVSDNNRTRE